MSEIVRFEGLDAWEKAKVLTWEIHAATSAGKFSRDFGKEIPGMMEKIRGGISQG